MDGVDGTYDGGGDDDDATYYTILLWYIVVSVGGGEFVNIANFTVCNGACVCGWGHSECADDVDGGCMDYEDVASLSYCGGGMARWNERVFGRNAKVSAMGLVDICGDCDSRSGYLDGAKKEFNKR